MISIDGAMGEGGGQVLRSALSLSLLTGQPFRMFNIRARRARPGLMPQHLQAVRAAASVGQADVSGAQQGSDNIRFEPCGIKGGTYDFNIGTAGSAPLVLQTLLVPLAFSGHSSQVQITGGTHVRWSPCFHYLDWQWRPYMQQAGYDFALKLEQAGFYPRGGGRMLADIKPANRIRSIEVLQRGRLLSLQGISAVANLDIAIAERQRHQALQRLTGWDSEVDIELQRFASPGRGSMLLLLARYEYSQFCCYALGERGKPAEQVADEAVDQLQSYANSDGAIDHYLADQLILPLALADGISRLRTARISSHLMTNAVIVQHFLPVRIELRGREGGAGMIEIDGCGWTGPHTSNTH